MSEEDFRDFCRRVDLDSSSEEEKEPEMTHEQIKEWHRWAVEIGEQEWEKYKKEPEISTDSRYGENDYTQKMYHLYYFAIQFVILHHKFNGNIPSVPQYKDSETTIREKSFYVFLNDCYLRFVHIVAEISSNVYTTFKERIQTHLGDQYEEHPISHILDCICKYKEMHSRRLKLDPATNKTKSDEVSSTYNAITGELYNNENKEHRIWRLIIFQPLPSDYDYKNKDPKESDDVAIANIKIDLMNGKYDIPEEFGYVVDNEWDRKLRVLHVLHHFKDYFYTFLVEGILEDQWNRIEHMNCQETVDFLFGKELPVTRHNNETKYSLWISRLDKKKKDAPILIYRIAVLRDILEAGIQFR
jgi:hypothetical protein